MAVYVWLARAVRPTLFEIAPKEVRSLIRRQGRKVATGPEAIIAQEGNVLDTVP